MSFIKLLSRSRVIIPSLFISIPLYDANGDAQQIVDAPRSAAFLRWHGQDAIADHSGQNGFQRISKAIPYKTTAYVKGEKFLCTKKQIGHIRQSKIFDSEWNHVKSDGLVMYTCIGKSAEDVMDVWLVYWKRILEV